MDAPVPVMLSLNEAAALAGVSRNTVSRMASKGKVPGARRIGDRLLFNRRLFLSWLGEEVERAEGLSAASG